LVKIKLTVIKRTKPEEVFGEKGYTTPNGKKVTECTAFKDGQEFIVEKLNKPEGFCGWAWRDVYKDIAVLNFGGNFTNWAIDGTQYTCCTDGVRPVIFKLERIED
jgi:uncharacterized repeat protein (TIGR04076 family)